MFKKKSIPVLRLTIPESKSVVYIDIATPQQKEPQLPALFKAACIVFMMFGISVLIAIYGTDKAQFNKFVSNNTMSSFVSKRGMLDNCGWWGFVEDGGCVDESTTTHSFGHWTTPTPKPVMIKERGSVDSIEDFFGGDKVHSVGDFATPSPTTTITTTFTPLTTDAPIISNKRRAHRRLQDNSTASDNAPTISNDDDSSTAVRNAIADAAAKPEPHVGTPVQPVGWALPTQKIGDLLAQIGNIPASNNIIMPLYVDPTSNGIGWKPVLDAIRYAPEANLTLVLNPSNGPILGATKPDLSYKVGLNAILVASKTVKFVGYVHQSFGQRSRQDVNADIDAWATWGKLYNVSMDGIFFDESPITVEMLTYVRQSNSYVKDIKYNAATKIGFRTNNPVTIQNPGATPPLAFFAKSQKQDISVILENSMDVYQQNVARYDGLSQRYGTTNDAFAFILYGGEDAQSVYQLQGTLAPMLNQASNIYITERTTEQYSKIGDTFKFFMKAIASQ